MAAADEKADYETRDLAVYLLKDIGPAARDAIPSLRSLLSCPAAQMQIHAAEALRSIDAGGVAPET